MEGICTLKTLAVRCFSSKGKRGQPSFTQDGCTMEGTKQVTIFMIGDFNEQKPR